MKPILILLCLFLCSCAHDSVSNSVANNAVNSINTLSATLPEECKTKSVKLQLDNIKASIQNIQNACDTEKEVLHADKVKWQWAFASLLIVFFVFMFRKFQI